MSMEELRPDSYTPTQGTGLGNVSPHQGGLPYYLTPELNQRLELLRHLTDNSERIAIVKGEEGAGKSAFLKKFKAHARPEWKICALEADPMLQPDQLFAKLCSCYEVAAVDSSGIDHLFRRFSQIQGEGGLAVIIIDDAHLLPVATILALLRLYGHRTADRVVLRVILFAEPEISSQLQTPQIQAMNMQAIQEFEMPRFSLDQCMEFIEHLQSGIEGEQAFSIPESRINRICSNSAGLPGVIETELFGAALQEASPGIGALKTPALRLLDDLPKPVLVGVPVLAFVLLLTLVFQDQINRFFEVPEESEIATLPERSNQAVVPLQLPDPVEMKEREVNSVTAEAERVADEASLDAVNDSKSIENLALPEASGSRVNEEPRKEESEPETAAQQVSQNKEAPQKSAEEAATADLNPLGGSKPKLIPLSSEDAGEKGVSVTVEKVIQGAPTAKVKEVPQPTKEVDLKPVPEVQAEVVRSLDAPPAPVKEVSIKGKAWLMKQKPSRYTLQLVGVRDEQAARKYIQQNGIADEAAYFKTIRDGKPWFSVVYGVFSGRDAAVGGKKTLPEKIRGGSSWPRSFASIHKSISP